MQKFEYHPGLGQAFGLATQRAHASIVPAKWKQLKYCTVIVQNEGTEEMGR
jgi:hypothetical protein